ncbi:hypothetical protein L211DRAFT_717264 [Terfezia boudieri ATCC MYA-4762]|uniref:Uncharacterized protein n=1 Tax=Terfezia boudieri ATCC MYA-4762 TaxID=1051890 RepID=A0A3N4LU00_9PEZI|nr:hypothetical protein L211DRAFT_717264 [Terfezia boudieri ATCC MYA-4762]
MAVAHVAHVRLATLLRGRQWLNVKDLSLVCTGVLFTLPLRPRATYSDLRTWRSGWIAQTSHDQQCAIWIQDNPHIGLEAPMARVLYQSRAYCGKVHLTNITLSSLPEISLFSIQVSYWDVIVGRWRTPIPMVVLLWTRPRGDEPWTHLSSQQHVCTVES